MTHSRTRTRDETHTESHTRTVATVQMIADSSWGDNRESEILSHWRVIYSVNGLIVLIEIDNPRGYYWLNLSYWTNAGRWGNVMEEWPIPPSDLPPQIDEWPKSGQYEHQWWQRVMKRFATICTQLKDGP